MNWDKFVAISAPYVPMLLRNSELLLRIFVAMILGMLIGNERKNRMKSAGMRTHALVALGSALMMVVSKYGFGDTVQGDGARLAAQVVSGVGFLGAGMIFVRHNLVSGLTTAAGAAGPERRAEQDRHQVSSHKQRPTQTGRPFAVGLQSDSLSLWRGSAQGFPLRGSCQKSLIFD